MKRRGLLMLVVLVVGALCVACADKPEMPAETAAPAAPAQSEVVVASTEVTATVTKIDQTTREVTLMMDDGEEFSLIADDRVKNLAQVQAGDVVIATYTEALAYEVLKGGEEASVETMVAGDSAELGEMPAGAATRSTTLTATVTAIDTEAPSVTIMGPSGEQRTIKVMYPEKLAGVNLGDSVRITYAEALALSVEKAPKE